MFIFLFLVGSTMIPSKVLADRPLSTEDAGTVEKSGVELELALDYLRDDNRDKYFIPSFQLAYGLTDRAEIGANIGYIFWDIHEGGREDGWGDVNVFLKYRIWDEGKFCPAFAVKPLVKIPTAHAKRNLGSGKVDYGLTLIFSKSLNDFSLHLDTGYLFIGEDHQTDVLSVGLAAEYELKKGLLAVGEVRWANNLNSVKNDDPAFLLLGLKKENGAAIFDAGVNLGLNNAAPNYGFTLGITLKFR